MDPQTPESAPHEETGTATGVGAPSYAADEAPAEQHDIYWALVGADGLRSGWAVLLFVAVFYAITLVLDTVAVTAYPALAGARLGPRIMVIVEGLPVLALAGAGLFLARVQQKSVLDYHWRGPKAIRHFAGGLAAGFAALSLLVGGLAAGGWLLFTHSTLNGAAALKYGAVWGLAFLLVGLFEEGSFRCFLLATLKRGMNFWWALGAVATACAVVAVRAQANGGQGVYVVALLGLAPCAWLQWKRTEGASFWQAAWVTSTAFGAYHTGNTGETAVGVFTASSIGFIFCVSVRLTGSAWWAIGCHASWDWAETYFYGTADSGFAAKGHLLTTMPRGDALWSGGAAGPEGSLLIVPVAVALLSALVAIYGRGRRTQTAVEAERLAG